MGKKGENTKKRVRNSNSNVNNAWTNADHVERDVRMRNNSKKMKQFERSQRLSHDNEEKRESRKIQLHITKVQRQLTLLKDRLKSWDDVTEKKRLEEEERKIREIEAKKKAPKKRRVRPGPETWKLRGAARPAWEVYDFDVRYVCPHQKAHEEEKERVGRGRNLFLLYKGKFGEVGESSSKIAGQACREYLKLLMQLGLLFKQAKKFKSARTTFLECLELDSTTSPITCARGHLMRIYMNSDRMESARRLWERLSVNDTNVWIRYSQALVEYISWKENEDGAAKSSADASLRLAIRANIYCCYYLAFGNEFFDPIMEYVEEIEDAIEGEPLEMAIEYCNSEQRKLWEKCDGAIEWIQSFIMNALMDTPSNKTNDTKTLVTREELDWRGPLQKMEDFAREDFRKQNEEEEQRKEGDSSKRELEQYLDEVDVLMFAGMFRTAMEMVEGKFEILESAK